ncbi:Ig-like domain-containing protein [Pseudomonas bijieensis]|uniref:Ig-like domain-containing protein n=1 Tax=Pseudomonas bijieensis TaxID=2681983 RepID=UPI002010A7B3|nr:Ig-like domain-containing protein [Pseudomonas bijieensis]UQI32630.1 Ig-like domain-containing protein [Pseudomonas bijieensis]
MDIQSSELDELFKMVPVIIPGWITPVKPVDLAHGGIPKSLYDDQPRGLQCLIEPLTEMQRHAWTLEAWDRVDLYVNDDSTPVAGDTVQPGEEANRMPLYIPHGRLINGVNRLHYIVTRPSDNSSQPSTDLFVLYHLRAPGEPAPEGLDLVIPSDVVDDGVSAERAAQGVEFGFAYTNPRNYDRINFLVGNVSVPFEVTDASMPVVKTLFTDTFQQAGDNPNTLVEYRVTDQLGNSNQSPTKRLDIHLDVVLIPPTLDSVKDADDEEIPEATTTFSTTLKLSGQASKGQKVEVYEGSGATAQPKGQATADATTGIWRLTITVETGDRRLYAKSLYHSGNVYSNVRTLKVERALTPAITSVKDSNNKEIIDGGTTVSTSVTLTGTATPGLSIKLLDGNTPKGSFTATNGIWTAPNISVAVGDHSFTAKAEYGTEPVSPAHTFNVAPPLNFGADYTMATLNYIIARVKIPNHPLPANNASYTRVATGGTPPYRYSSASPNIAVVDSSSGYVRAAGNGQAVITATDQDDSTASYTVTVSGVMPVILLPSVQWGYAGVLEYNAYELLIANYAPEGFIPSIIPGWPNSWYWARTGHANQTHGMVKNMRGEGSYEEKTKYYPALQHVAARADRPDGCDFPEEEPEEDRGSAPFTGNVEKKSTDGNT